MIFRISRILWKTVKWTFLVIASLFALLVLINWRDEPMSDEARALLEAKPKKVPDRENIVVAMAGFTAPENVDMFVAGRKEINRFKKRSKQESSEFQDEQENVKKQIDIEQEEGEWLRWKQEIPFDCRIIREMDYLECLHSGKEALEKAQVANETLIQRYRVLQGAPRYFEDHDDLAYHLPIAYSPMERAQRHLSAKAVLDMMGGDAKTGLAFFKNDMAFLRRRLEGNCSVVDSLFVSTHMIGNVRRLSLSLSSPSFDPGEQESEWRELLVPLTHEQYSLRTQFVRDIGQYRYWMNMSGWLTYQEAIKASQACRPEESGMFTCSALRKWLENNGKTLFFKQNAMFNYAVPYYKTWLRLTGLPWKDYLEQRDEALAFLAEHYKAGIDWVYNPVGKKDFNDFYFHPDLLLEKVVGKFRDLDAYLRLVRLQLELRLANLSSEEIPAFITQLDEPYCSPCADFSWDAETRMLSFQPYDEKQFTRFAPASVYVP